MRYSIGALFLSSTMIALVAAPMPKAKVVKDEDALLGKWMIEIKSEAKGSEPGGNIKRFPREYKNDGKITIRLGERERDIIHGEYKIDSTTKPKSIDTTLDTPEGKQSSVGIYELDGDTLKICLCNAPKPVRPTEFKEDRFAGVWLMTFKHAKEDAKADSKPAENKKEEKKDP